MKRFLAIILTLASLSAVACSAKLEAAPEEAKAEITTEAKTEAGPAKPVQKETKEEETKEALPDPKEDNELNVFFVSNSTCYYFTDELYGLLTAAGYENVTLALAYYSGCPLEKHYNWLQQDYAGYQLRIIDERGLTTRDNYSLRMAMNIKNWDVISFDNNSASFGSGNAEKAIDIAEPYFGKLHEYMKKNFPDARLLWHQVWAAEIGAKKSTFEVNDVAKRTQIYQAKHDVMLHMMDTYGIEGVPTGDAWEKVRDLPLFTTVPKSLPEVTRFTLCSRIMKNKFYDDFGHDGDIGGGQYLNACVWFEILTGKSCVGNTFRPEYIWNGIDLSLSEEKIAVLQKAAHEAVAEHLAR